MHLNVDFDVKIERRDDFDATIEREIISIQNICFLDVANDVSKNEILEIVFDEITDDVSINVDSFDENVANDVNIAINAMSVRFVIIVFNVEKDVNIAIIAISFNVNLTNFVFDVNFAYSFDVVIAIIANIVFVDCFFCCCELNF